MEHVMFICIYADANSVIFIGMSMGCAECDQAHPSVSKLQQYGILFLALK